MVKILSESCPNIEDVESHRFYLKHNVSVPHHWAIRLQD